MALVSTITPNGRSIRPVTAARMETITLRLTEGELAVILDYLSWEESTQSADAAMAYEEVQAAYLDLTGRTAL